MPYNNKKILNNALFLMVRLTASFILSFFTTRIVLRELGVVDYGIFAVIGGLLVFVSFFSNAMASSTQRHLSFEIGKGNKAKVALFFKASIHIYIFIALLFILLAETVGYYFFTYNLNIPSERMEAAAWVYHCIIFIFLINIMMVPFQAMINAKEDMHIIAIKGIAEAVLGLLIGYSLINASVDKFKLYAVLTVLANLLLWSFYFVYCKRKYREISFKGKVETATYKELSSFAGWTLFGILGAASRTQGLAILLNMFFGPVMNTAHGIANQIAAKINDVTNVITQPFAPQIIQSYAHKNMPRTNKLSVLSSRYSIYIALAICLPLYFKTDFILTIWLKNFPPSAVIITKWLLVNTILTMATNPLITIMQATGRIKKYQILIGTSFILNIPIAYFFLQLDNPYYSIFISLIIVTIITNAIKIFFVKYHTGLNIGKWILVVVIKPLLLACGVMIIRTLLWKSGIYNAESVLHHWIDLSLIFFMFILAVLFIGLDRGELKQIKQRYAAK